MTRVSRLLPLVLTVACSGGSRPSTTPVGGADGGGGSAGSGDADTASPDPDCAGVPQLSWDAWGDGFFATYCRSCHAATAPDRHGAPGGVDFDVEADVIGQAERIRVRTLELGTMPLGGGVPAADLEALDAYLRCGLGSPGGSGVPEVDETELQPDWDAAALQAALDDALGDGLPQVHEVRSVYLDFFTYGDDICPGHEDYIDDLWLYGCWSEGFVFFSGVSEFVSAAAPEAEPATRSWSIFGDLLFLDSTYNAFDGGGDVWSEVEVSRSGDAERWTRHLGTWAYAAHPGLLADGVSGVLDQTLTRRGATDAVRVDGSVQFQGSSLRFDSLEVGLTGSCSGLATGAVALRAPTGGWYRVELGDACGTCGAAVFEGRETLGEVCLDLAPIATQARAELDGVVSGAIP